MIQDQQPPVFVLEDGISISELNEVAKRAYGPKYSGQGVNITRRGNIVFFSIPNEHRKFKARVYAFDDDYYGYYSQYGECGKQTYKFYEQKAVRCGEFQTLANPPGLYGNGITIRAFELRDRDVEDGSVQELEHHISYYDPFLRVFRHEYMFRDDGASQLPFPELDQYSGYGDQYYGDGCEITDSITIRTSENVDGECVVTETTIYPPFPFVVCTNRIS